MRRASADVTVGRASGGPSWKGATGDTFNSTLSDQIHSPESRHCSTPPAELRSSPLPLSRSATAPLSPPPPTNWKLSSDQQVTPPRQFPAETSILPPSSSSSGMTSSEADSRLNQVLIPALEKIQKNASWRKHSKLGSECKSVIEHLTSPNRNPSAASPPTSPSAESDANASLLQGVLLDLSLYDSEIVLSPLINALSANYLKVSEPALDAVQKLVAHGYLHGEADPSGGADSKLLSKLIDSACKCHELGDENVELLVIKSLLSAVTSASLRLHGDCLLQVVRTCYDIYLNSKNLVNQTTAKASLVQMLVIVFRRMEADSSTVPLQPIVVAELVEPAEKADVDGSMIFVQSFITKIMQDIDGVFSPGTPSGVTGSGAGAHDGAFETKTSTVEGTNPADLLDSTDKDMLDAKYWEISMYKTALEGRKGELADGEGERDDDLEVQIGNKLRRDAFLVFRALCKLSMKTPPKDVVADPQAMKGKIVALELLKLLLENAGAIFRTSERYLIVALFRPNYLVLQRLIYIFA